MRVLLKDGPAVQTLSNKVCSYLIKIKGDRSGTGRCESHETAAVRRQRSVGGKINDPGVQNVAVASLNNNHTS